eukprot:170058-Amphidinium_carterae.1
MEGKNAHPGSRALLNASGSPIYDAKSKACLFARHYANISSSRTVAPRFERHLKRQCHERLYMASDQETAPPITWSEVCHSLSSMHGGKAAGPDMILPEFLHNLGNTGKQLLQFIFNAFLRFDR